MEGSFSELAVERVREEWFKWAAKSTVPSAGLQFLAATNWIRHFPEIAALRGTPQDPDWHPEGDVFIHTCHCCDALVKLPEWQEADEEARIVLSFAILTHDFGKCATTREAIEEGRIRIISPGHEEASAGLAETFLGRFRAPLAIVERVIPLVRNHMAHMQEVSDRAVRRLSQRLEPESIDHLCTVMTADAFGRPPRPPTVPRVVSLLLAKAAELRVRERAPEPILGGRHLLKLGMSAGPEMGVVLHRVYEAQLEGRFSDLDGALRWLAEELNQSNPAVAAKARVSSA